MNKKLLELVLELIKNDKTKAPFSVGEKLLVRTVSFFVSGEVVEAGKEWLTLKDAAWIADTGRFHLSVQTGDFDEVEPVDGPVRINLGAVEDVYVIPKCPREAK